MSSFLKEHLGEDLYNQVKEKLGDKKIDIVNTGNWIPYEKFNSLIEDNKILKGRIKELEVKELDHDKVSKEIEALKNENKDIISKYEKTLKDKELNFALENALREAKVRNTKAVRALINHDMIQINDEGKLSGIEEQIKSLKETDSYLFEPSIKGREPNLVGGSKLNGKNPFSKEHYNLTEQGKIFKENPELARKMMEEANLK